MHVDQVGSLLSCCESIEPIFGVDEVIFPALLDPDYVFFESLILIIFCFFESLILIMFCFFESLILAFCFLKKKKVSFELDSPDVLLAFIFFPPIFSFVLSSVHAPTSFEDVELHFVGTRVESYLVPH